MRAAALRRARPPLVREAGLSGVLATGPEPAGAGYPGAAGRPRHGAAVSASPGLPPGRRRPPWTAGTGGTGPAPNVTGPTDPAREVRRIIGRRIPLLDPLGKDWAKPPLVPGAVARRTTGSGLRGAGRRRTDTPGSRRRGEVDSSRVPPRSYTPCRVHAGRDHSSRGAAAPQSGLPSRERLSTSSARPAVCSPARRSSTSKYFGEPGCSGWGSGGRKDGPLRSPRKGIAESHVTTQKSEGGVDAGPRRPVGPDSEEIARSPPCRCRDRFRTPESEGAPPRDRRRSTDIVKSTPRW